MESPEFSAVIYTYHGNLERAREQKAERDLGDCGGVLKVGHFCCPLGDMSLCLLRWIVRSDFASRKVGSWTDWLFVNGIFVIQTLARQS